MSMDVEPRSLIKTELTFIQTLHDMQKYYKDGKPTQRYKQVTDRSQMHAMQGLIEGLIKQQLVVLLPHTPQGKLSWYVKLTKRGEAVALANRARNRLIDEMAAKQTRLIPSADTIQVGSVVSWFTPDGKQSHTGRVVVTLPEIDQAELTLGEYLQKYSKLDLAQYHLCNVKALTNRPHIKLRKTPSYLVEVYRGPGMKPALYWPNAVKLASNAALADR